MNKYDLEKTLKELGRRIAELRESRGLIVIPINLASDSEVIWPPFPKQFGHPVS